MFWLKRYYQEKLPRATILAFMERVANDFFPPLQQRVSLQEYVDKIMNEGYIIYIQYKCEIVGLAAYYCNPEKYEAANITFFAILSKYRQRQLGRSLLVECIHDIKLKNVKIVETQTWSTNDVGIKLYERLGFKKYRVIENDRGNMVSTICLRLVLDS